MGKTRVFEPSLCVCVCVCVCVRGPLYCAMTFSTTTHTLPLTFRVQVTTGCRSRAHMPPRSLLREEKERRANGRKRRIGEQRGAARANPRPSVFSSSYPARRYKKRKTEPARDNGGGGAWRVARCSPPPPSPLATLYSRRWSTFAHFTLQSAPPS